MSLAGRVTVMAMGSVSVSRTIFATNQRKPVSVRITTPFPGGGKFHRRPARLPFRFISSFKKSDYQDFQGFAKPSRLLPSKELKVCKETLEEKIFSSTNLNGASSFYKVRLQTSNMYGSSLSDINAGILLCLIDEKGDSILQRIPALFSVENSAESRNKVDPETLHFQRGSVDEFVFEGPTLGNIKAVWISLESGQWRLAGASLTIFNAPQASLGENSEENLEFVGFEYYFSFDEILLGEGGDVSMVELKPYSIKELSGNNLVKMLSEGFSQTTSPSNEQISNDQSMKEYADLKFSLLLYDAIIIFVGTSFASISIGESSGFAFLLGGISGFLYLLLLQRSVDGLPASELMSKSPGGQQINFRGPLAGLALAVSLSLLAVKYSMGDDVPFVLTPKELLAGMMGFLVSKVAVVLAAFMPLPISIQKGK